MYCKGSAHTTVRLASPKSTEHVERLDVQAGILIIQSGDTTLSSGNIFALMALN